MYQQLLVDRILARVRYTYRYSRCTVLVATDDYSRTVPIGTAVHRYSCSMATAVLHGYPDTVYCMATSSYCTSMATAAL